MNRLSEVEYLVEATEFERECLWVDNCYGTNKKVVWESSSEVFAPIVGYIDNGSVCEPVVIYVNYVTINNHMVAFWRPISTFVDFNKVDEYLTENCTNCFFKTKAQNFSQVINRVRGFK